MSGRGDRRGVGRGSRLGGIAELFVPRTCAGCGTETVALCGACLSHLDPVPQTVLPRYGTRPVTGAGEYTGPLRQVIISYKELDRLDVAPVLSLLLAAAVVASLFDSVGPGRISLVPVPASPAGMRRRGGNHVARLARSACRLLRSDGLDAECREVLRVRRHRDQVGRTRAGRRANVAGTHALDPRADLRALTGTNVVLVDDICTTGATAAESARALAAAQFPVDSVAVLAIAPETGRPRPGPGI